MKAAAAERWVAAVNADGKFGRWLFKMTGQVPEVPGIIDEAAAYFASNR